MMDRQVNRSRQTFYKGALFCAIALVLITGCTTKGDPIAAAEQADKMMGIVDS